MNILLNRLKVHRYGINEDSFMITNKLIQILKPYSCVKINKNNILKEIYEKQEEKKLLWKEPNNVIIEGYNKNNEDLILDNTNILGKNDYFIVDMKTLTIPIIENPTKQLLKYYNCKLVKEDDIIELQNNRNMYYFSMNIGINYMNGYLLRKNYGNGFYLETHDTPHLHIPQNKNSRGYIVIGKKIDNKYQLSAFRIPYNYGIYIPPNVPHCDGTLIGEYNVLYTISDDYKTKLLYNKDMNILNVELK